MKLTIRFRDGEHIGEVTFDCEFEDGDVIDLTALPTCEPGNYVGNLDTGELIPTGRAN